MRFKRANRGKIARKVQGRTTRSIAVRAIAGVSKLRKIVHPETYHFDSLQSLTTPNTTAQAACITNLAEGDDVGNRSGNSIYVKSIELKYHSFVNETNVTPQIMRTTVLVDTSYTGTPPTSAQIYQYSASEQIVDSPFNADNIPRFKILYDKVHWLAKDSQEAQHFRKIIRVNRRVNYVGTSAVDADLGKGQIYVVYSSSSASLNAPNMSWATRVNYLDH